MLGLWRKPEKQIIKILRSSLQQRNVHCILSNLSFQSLQARILISLQFRHASFEGLIFRRALSLIRCNLLQLLDRLSIEPYFQVLSLRELRCLKFIDWVVVPIFIKRSLFLLDELKPAWVSTWMRSIIKVSDEKGRRGEGITFEFLSELVLIIFIFVIFYSFVFFFYLGQLVIAKGFKATGHVRFGLKSFSGLRIDGELKVLTVSRIYLRMNLAVHCSNVCLLIARVGQVERVIRLHRVESFHFFLLCCRYLKLFYLLNSVSIKLDVWRDLGRGLCSKIWGDAIVSSFSHLINVVHCQISLQVLFSVLYAGERSRCWAGASSISYAFSLFFFFINHTEVMMSSSL